MATHFSSITSRLPSPGPSVASSASDSDPLISTDHDARSTVQVRLRNPLLIDRIANDNPPILPNTSRFKPFAEDPHAFAKTPRWQKDLDRHCTIIFKKSVLSDYSIDEMALRTLQVIGSPTKSKIRGIALAVFMHWTRMQFHSTNVDVSAAEIVTLILRIADHLGSMSVHAEDFLDELNSLCIEKLKLTWRWFVDVLNGEALPLPRENLLIRVTAVVAMIGHLFRGGLLQYDGALSSLEYLASFLPLPDAVATIYALLLRLGSEFAMEQTGCHFLQRLLARLSPFTVGRFPADRLCHLVFAVNALVADWQSRTRVMLYHTCPGGNNPPDAQHYSQT